MVRWPLVLASLLAACASSPSTPDPTDLCSSNLPRVAGGTAELGFGSQFSPMLDGQDVSLQLGIQGFWMFVVNARVTDMNVGTDADAAAVQFQILDASGNVVSLQTGCRDLDFLPAEGGALQLAAGYALPFDQTFGPKIEGAHVTIEVDVRDRDGREATDRRTIISHMPANGSAHPFVRATELTPQP